MSLLFESEFAAGAVCPLHFPDLAGTTPPVAAGNAPVPEAEAGQEAANAAEQRHAQDVRESRERALAEATETHEARLRESLETERTALAHICTRFAQERSRYFNEIESETVRLALAIAARILQREVKLDPLLLAGVVRVALRRLGSDAGVVLHVPAEQAAMWQESVRSPEVRVVAEEGMAPGEVRLQSPAGSADLGVSAQLVEIERGFFDLLAKRPA